MNFSNILYDQSCEILYQSLKQACVGNVNIDNETKNYIVCYSDLCAIIEPILIEMQTCNTPQFAEKALEVVREIVVCYKNAVTEICERKLNVPLICIAGFCNDTNLIIERFKSWQIMVKSYVEASLINNHLKTRQLSQEVNTLEQVAKNFFSLSLIEKIENSFELPFNELHMDILFPQIVNELNALEGFTDKDLMNYM